VVNEQRKHLGTFSVPDDLANMTDEEIDAYVQDMLGVAPAAEDEEED
jgi:hypothetical protein